MWVHILKSKDEAFVRFKEWKILTERHTGKKVRRIRTDNSLGYFSEQFNKLCAKEGITRHKIVKRTPQHNGLAERMNMTILERVRCIINNAGLPKSFWGEAVTTICYLISKCPSQAIGLKTPMEM